MKKINSWVVSVSIAIILILLNLLMVLFFLRHYSLQLPSYQSLFYYSILAIIIITIVAQKLLSLYIKFRIRKIYKKVNVLKKSKRQLNNKDEFDYLTKDIFKYFSKHRQEINTLNSRENYRRDFLGNVAHELKTPLFTVQGYLLTLIEGAAEDQEIRDKYLNRANIGIDRLTAIVNDLDLITKLETHELKLKIEFFNILKLIDKVFEMFEIQAKAKNITLKYDKKYISEFVKADQSKIEQVLINLIMNSIKYGKENGTTTISIQPKNNNKTIIAVKDDGEGIPEVDLPRIFERFYRIDKSRSREQGGSGLGLSIVKHIIEAHQDNTITVNSKLGEGSCFIFTLNKI